MKRKPPGGMYQHPALAGTATHFDVMEQTREIHKEIEMAGRNDTKKMGPEIGQEEYAASSVTPARKARENSRYIVLKKGSAKLTDDEGVALGECWMIVHETDDIDAAREFAAKQSEGEFMGCTIWFSGKVIQRSMFEEA